MILLEIKGTLLILVMKKGIPETLAIIMHPELRLSIHEGIQDNMKQMEGKITNFLLDIVEHHQTKSGDKISGAILSITRGGHLSLTVIVIVPCRDKN